MIWKIANFNFSPSFSIFFERAKKLILLSTRPYRIETSKNIPDQLVERINNQND